MAIHTPYFDCIGEWEAVSGPLADDHFVSIDSALQSGVSNVNTHRQEIWVKPSKWRQEKVNHSDCYWLQTGTIKTVSGLSQSTKIKGCGGFGRILDIQHPNTPSGATPDYRVGTSTMITRLTYTTGNNQYVPFFELRGCADTLDGLYLRGTSNLLNGQQNSHTAVEIRKISSNGVGTRNTTFHDMTFQYFATGVNIGKSSSTNCDTVLFDLVDFHGVDTCIRMNMDQVIGVWLNRVYAHTSDVIVDCNGGGMVVFNDQLITKTNQVGLKIRSSNVNPGSFSFYDLKFDNQSDGAIAVNMDTITDANGFNTINFFGGRDSRNMPSASTDELLGKFVGNCTVNLYGFSNVPLIYVSGKRVNAGGPSQTVNCLSAPTISMHGCQFKNRDYANDPRLLIRRFDGTLAVEGEDYSALHAYGCQIMSTQGTPLTNDYLNKFTIDLPYKLNPPSHHRGY